MSQDAIHNYFQKVTSYANGLVQGNEILLCNVVAEDSTFVRFNNAKVRQPGSVLQFSFSFRLVQGKKHCATEIMLSGDFDQDRAQISSIFTSLRAKITMLVDDPLLLINEEVKNSEHISPSQLPSHKTMVDEILDLGQGTDMVGILAAGGIYRGFSNSLGQSNWFESHNFNFDYSLVHSADKAVKSSYAGTSWDSTSFSSSFDLAKRKLAILKRDSKDIQPGKYRVFLSEVAVGEVLGLLSWGGFSLQSQRSKSSSLHKLIEGTESLDPRITIKENVVQGACPQFQSQGFLSPDSVTFVDEGKHVSSLISPRSAKEYGVENNGASDYETPSSLDMSGGGLEDEHIISTLDTGLYISNLWYLNYSDRMACRMTGMTRFATFWVENGEVVAPVNVIRFDDTLYSLLGSENLQHITKERQFLLSASSYHHRSTESMRLPGVITSMNFTL
jgi:predicted Zn-dependent protease